MCFEITRLKQIISAGYCETISLLNDSSEKLKIDCQWIFVVQLYCDSRIMLSLLHGQLKDHVSLL